MAEAELTCRSCNKPVPKGTGHAECGVDGTLIMDWDKKCDKTIDSEQRK